MTEEAEKKEPLPEKLLIDDPNDFRFHAAYLVYSEVFDRKPDAQVRAELNQMIEALKANKIEYPEFYGKIGQYRSSAGYGQDQSRFFMKTMRKKDWRRATQKNERIRRHRK